jgi:hypothetical protein
MLARGYDGTLPAIDADRQRPAADWVRALAVPVITAAIATVALVTQ